MEKLLVKTGIYSFLCSLAVGILFMDRTVTVPDGSGMYTSYEKDLSEYIFQVLRFAFSLALIAMVLALLYKLYQKYKN